MANNMGFLLIAGLGALMFLGRGVGTKATDEDNRLLVPPGRGKPMAAPLPPAASGFNLQSYIDGLFGDMATVPVQPPMSLFFPPNVVVTSSGVPGTSSVAPEIITPTTKVVIGGDGGETITASALAVRRSEQIAQQEFQYAANVFAPPPGETADRNRIEEERQRKFARDLIAKNIADQLARNKVVVERTRLQQENINPIVAAIPPTINFDYPADDEWSINPFSTPGQAISVPGGEAINVDFTPQYSETFVISGGMDSPSVFDVQVELLGQSEYDDPGPAYYAPAVPTVHEITAAYDIGF